MRSKNDIAWQKLFTQHEIVQAVNEHGLFEISSSQINEHREARLMTKFDHKDSLPQLFIDENLSILPVSRGNYVIGRFQTFQDFEKKSIKRKSIKIESVKFPPYIEGIDPTYISSEAGAIHCAFITGMLAKFTETEESKLKPTVSGRMGTPSFKFLVERIDENRVVTDFECIEVENAQVEIDGGYESPDALWLIEAKNVVANDFLVRQLYYPYRLWSAKINKLIRLIFMTYSNSNGIFHLREYKFSDPYHYNSASLIKEMRYVISDHEYNINEGVIRQLLDKGNVEENADVPYPQANSFGWVINLCELLYKYGQMNKDEIAQEFGFVSRQSDYYTNAGLYLELIKKEKHGKQSVYLLTERGKALFDMPIDQRRLMFVEAILEHEPFNRTLSLYFDKMKRPTKAEIIQIMDECGVKTDSSTTKKRRAQATLSWVDWILDLF